MERRLSSVSDRVHVGTPGYQDLDAVEGVPPASRVQRSPIYEGRIAERVD